MTFGSLLVVDVVLELSTMSLVAIDLGSRWIGVTAAEPPLPVRILASSVVELPKGTVDDPSLFVPVVDHLVGCALVVQATLILIEHSPYYPPTGATEQAKVAMAHAHEICSTLRTLLMLRFMAIGIRVVTMPRATWSHRLVPRTQGGISDEMVNAALPAQIEAGAQLLTTQDQRDAAGMLVGHLMPLPRRRPPREPREDKPKGKPGRPRKPRIDQGPTPAALARAAAGCRCGPRGRHAPGCPARGPTPREREIIAALERGSWLEPESEKAPRASEDGGSLPLVSRG